LAAAVAVAAAADTAAAAVAADYDDAKMGEPNFLKEVFFPWEMGQKKKKKTFPTKNEEESRKTLYFFLSSTNKLVIRTGSKTEPNVFLKVQFYEYFRSFIVKII